MGFFSSKAVCGCCGNECGLNRFKIKKSNAWLCANCLKKAGGPTTINVSKVTIEEIKDIINHKDQKAVDRRTNSTTGIATAEDMYSYAKQNGFGRGLTEGWGIKHFKVVEENLMPREEVLMTFIGLHNYISTTKHDKYFAYAITNKRFIMGQKQVVGEKLQSVYLDNINDITFESGIAFGVMTIDTIKEVFNVGLDKGSIKAITLKAHEVVDDLKHSQTTPQNVQIQATSDADEILKFKQLFDSGVITQDEFETKKKQLLGL